MATTLKSMTSLTVLRSPAAERNKQPLLKVLAEAMPANEPVQALEIASGIHCIYRNFTYIIRTFAGLISGCVLYAETSQMIFSY